MSQQAKNYGPYTLAAKSSFYYWFYPDGGNWSSYGTLTKNDPRMLYILPRPSHTTPDWSVFAVHTRVVLEKDPGDIVYRYSYRVLVENPTNSSVIFYIAVYKLGPLLGLPLPG